MARASRPQISAPHFPQPAPPLNACPPSAELVRLWRILPAFGGLSVPNLPHPVLLYRCWLSFATFIEAARPQSSAASCSEPLEVLLLTFLFVRLFLFFGFSRLMAGEAAAFVLLRATAAGGIGRHICHCVRLQTEYVLVVASTFFIGVGAVGVALARVVISLITGLIRFLVGLARTIVAMAWVLLQAIFGRRD